MERMEIFALTGIIAALIWLCVCFFMEGKKRKYVIIAGIIIDVMLFMICRSYRFLLAGVLGGLACGLMPGLGKGVWKYEIAIREFNGIKNWTVVSVILFVMVCMVLATAGGW